MTLYFGLKPTHKHVTHYPLIKIIPRNTPIPPLTPFTHIILTSQTTTTLLLQQTHIPKDKILIAIGPQTAKGLHNPLIPSTHTQEGIITLLKNIQGNFFYPHSSLSRTILTSFLKENKYPFTEFILYDTIPYKNGPLPNLKHFSELIFTSPSVVDAYIHFFGKFPKDKKLIAIGPVTEEYLFLKKKNFTRGISREHNF